MNKIPIEAESMRSTNSTGIKPYKIYVKSALCHNGELSMFFVYTNYIFEEESGHVVPVGELSKFTFNPNDVAITDEMHKTLDEAGIMVPDKYGIDRVNTIPADMPKSTAIPAQTTKPKLAVMDDMEFSW